MKRSIFRNNLCKFLFALIGILFFVQASMVNFNIKKSVVQSSYAEDSLLLGTASSDEEKYSIFINEPTFTFVYGDNLYFFDKYDSKFKAYNLVSAEFLDNYLDLSSFDTIIDATICDDNVFLIGQKNNNYYIAKINLTDDFSLEYIKYNDENYYTNAKLSKIFATKMSDESVDYYVLVLTPAYSSETSVTLTTSPKILILNENLDSIANIIEINFTGSLDREIKEQLFEILISYSNESTDYVNMLFICKTGIYGLNLQKSLFNQTLITLEDRCSFYREIEKENEDDIVSILNVDLYKNFDRKFLFMSYTKTAPNGSITSLTKIYEINVAVGIGSIFDKKFEFETNNSSYFCVSENTLTYPFNQDINKICLNFELVTDELKSYVNVSILKSGEEDAITISNPTLKVRFLAESEFKIAKTNKNTPLLSSPWNSNGIFDILSNTDVIIIGNGYIEGNSTLIEDYKYCLLTISGQNKLGYIKSSDIDYKREIPLTDYDFKNCKVIANTALYSLPTKVLGDNIAGINTKIITEISSNEDVKVIDALCKYNSNGSIFLKVQVGDNVGYIESNQVQNKRTSNIFSINDATVKLDNTYVYLKEDASSEILITLKAGDRVKVLESKNKATGFCLIEFHDDLGNTITGYVNADHIKNDKISTMQIIGGILIISNVIILIVVMRIIFKKMDSNNKKSFSSDEEDTEIDLQEK